MSWTIILALEGVIVLMIVSTESYFPYFKARIQNLFVIVSDVSSFFIELVGKVFAMILLIRYIHHMCSIVIPEALMVL